MRTKIKAFAAVVAATAGVLLAVSPAALAGPGALGGDASIQATCPTGGWSDKDKTGVDYSNTNANIRTGTGTNCTSVGQALPAHKLDLHCWKAGDAWTWTHLRDTVTGKQGWVRDDLLKGGGSRVQC
jgi:hypothetical protein